MQMTNDYSPNLRKFKAINLKMVSPDFSSDIIDQIMSLDSLRNPRIAASTPRHIFFQIKNFFQILESVCSARIEGNRTTLVEYIDRKFEKDASPPESFREIENMEKSLRFIDENIGSHPLDRAFVSELHKKTVDGLDVEGSNAPGSYRDKDVSVRGSILVPPPPGLVPSLMDELFNFILCPTPPKYDLIKTALAHHRFAWIHPFDNGNGRTARLFTYALLINLGFYVNYGSLINPAAVFCWDRGEYYRALARADEGDDEGYLSWIKYMLSGLQRELKKVIQLADYDYLKGNILLPAIEFSRRKNIINETEHKILSIAIEKKEIRNADIRKFFPSKHPADISHLIKELLEKKYLAFISGKKRIYAINFENNGLLRGLVYSLSRAGIWAESKDLPIS